MANCNTINSLLNGCAGNNIGGIYEVYIIDALDYTASTVSTSAHTVTNIGTAVDFSTFQFKRNVGNFVIEEAQDLLVGSDIFTPTLTLSFARRQASTSRAISILSEGQRYLNIIVKSADGTYTLLEDMQLSTSSENSGTAKAEGSKYDLTFVGSMEHRPYFVDSAIIAGLIA
jgi:hypothetical protein